MQTKLAMFEYLKLQAFIMHFCMIRLRKYIRTLVITRNNQHYHVNIVHTRFNNSKFDMKKIVGGDSTYM